MKKYVGKKYSDVKDILENLPNVRLIFNDSFITADFVPGRIDVYIDENGVICDVDQS
jgi:hypothetical protein